MTGSKKQGTETPGFKKMGMVDWYSPAQLTKTGLRAVVSSVFGNYADKRETQAALTRNQKALKPFDFSDREELWLDYVSDLGSGWDSTYSVAYLLGRRELAVKDQSGSEHKLKRGNILVMGGDEVYPTATPKEYQNRLVGPYTSSLSYVDEENDPPTLFAIPGNHDWYDGLSSFIKIVLPAAVDWRMADPPDQKLFCGQASPWLVALGDRHTAKCGYRQAPDRLFRRDVQAGCRRRPYYIVYV